jgi:hypothetical protein
MFAIRHGEILVRHAKCHITFERLLNRFEPGLDLIDLAIHLL